MRKLRALVVGAAIATCLAGASSLVESFANTTAIRHMRPALTSEPVVLAAQCAVEDVKHVVIRILGF